MRLCNNLYKDYMKLIIYVINFIKKEKKMEKKNYTRNAVVVKWQESTRCKFTKIKKNL